MNVSKNGQNATQIEFIHTFSMPSITKIYTTEIYITTNLRQLIARTIRYDLGGIITTQHPITTSGALNVNLIILGKTLKLIDLPTYPPFPAESNTVFRETDYNGNYYLKIKA